MTQRVMEDTEVKTAGSMRGKLQSQARACLLDWLDGSSNKVSGN